MAVDRREVFARLPVDVQLDGHRRVTSFLDHPQPYPLRGEVDRYERARGTRALEVGDAHRAPVGQMKSGVGMRGVLDQNLARRQWRHLPVVGLRPTIVGVKEPRLRRNHLPEVELDLAEQSTLVEAGIEALVLG